jgi:hypothetical protein
MAQTYQYPDCFETYLRYAISTNFRNFEPFSDRDFALLLLVELNRADQAAEFAAKMAGFGAAPGPNFGPDFGAVSGPTRYVTMRSGTLAILSSDAHKIWRDMVTRVELSLPIKPVEKARFVAERVITPRFAGANELLIGILDDGCPFAAAQFLTTSTNNTFGTRVRGIWDQNTGKQPATVPGVGVFGRELTDFDFGIEYLRDLPPAAGEIPINDWINMHSSPSGVVDEDGCYANAGFKTLARRESHGAHVMDVLMGRIPTSSRVGPPNERRDPPNWKPAADAASRADLVFVQFSDECIRDATGVWLKYYVVEGIKYILSFAKPGKTKKVVVNLSYGPTTGPHDGTAELEAELIALVTQFDGSKGRPQLEIVLPAGNAYFSEGHVAFERGRTTDPDHAEWTWRLPPDNSVLCFAEIWMNTAAATNAMVTLTPPSGYTIFVPTAPPYPPPLPGDPLPPAGVDVPLVRGNNMMWRLHVQSTLDANETAEHGDWKINVSGIGVGARVHAYVARSDPNMGARTGAKRSYFVDQVWEQTHMADAGCRYADGEFAEDGSLIERFGTLNGIATARHPRIHVAGGFIIANQRKAPYSSAGPARRFPPPIPRIGPDVVLPCDESYALGGIRAGGNRSGGMFRLSGTSAAAPQLARYVAGSQIPPTRLPPASQEEEQRRGRGNLDPP